MSCQITGRGVEAPNDWERPSARNPRPFAFPRPGNGQVRGTVADGGYAFLGVRCGTTVRRESAPAPRPVVGGCAERHEVGSEPPQVPSPASVVSGWITGTGEDCSVLNV